MKIPYLTGGESLSAESRNLIWEEFSRKVSLLMDNHSLLFLYPQLRFNGVFGRKFFFLGNNPILCNRWFTGQNEFGYWNYNHSVFTNAVNLTPVFDSNQTYNGVLYPKPPIMVDDVRQIVRIKYPSQSYVDQVKAINADDLLNWSLEAHKKTFIPTGAATPLSYNALVGVTGAVEYEHLYDLAEIICEGVGEWRLRPEWNKYRFYRIHNLRDTRLVVVLGDLVSEVNPWDSKCFRKVGNEWVEGYAHFNPFASGDPRIYDIAQTFSISEIDRTSAKGNNVANQKLLPDLVNYFENSSSPKFNIDPREFWDARDTYVPNYFGDPYEESTKLGDLLYHKGKLLDVKITGTTTDRRLIDYGGMDSLQSDFAAAGIVATSTASFDGTSEYALTSATGTTRDLWCLSSNLGVTPMTIVKPPSNNSNGLGLSGVYCDNYSEYKYESQTYNASWVVNLSGGTASVPLVIDYLKRGFGSFDSSYEVFNARPESYFSLTDTVSSIEQSQHDDVPSEFFGQEMTLTGFGPIFTWSRSITLKPTDPAIGVSVNESTLRNINTLSNGVLTINDYGELKKFKFNPPTGVFYTRPEEKPSGWPTRSDLIFNCPRADQYYGSVFGKAHTATILDNQFTIQPGTDKLHPDFDSKFDAKPISDNRCKVIASAPQKSGISFLSPLNYAGNKLLTLANWILGKDTTWPYKPNPATIQTVQTSNPDYYRLNRTTYYINSIDTDGSGLLFDRLVESIDTYNNMASLVNGIVSVDPIHFTVVFPELVANNASPFRAFTSSDTLSTIRPFNQYMGEITSGSADHSLLLQLGATISTKADLPASYAQLFAEKNKFRRIKNRFSYSYFVRYRDPTGYYDYTNSTLSPPVTVNCRTGTDFYDVVGKFIDYEYGLDEIVDGDNPILSNASFAFGEGAVNLAAVGKFLNNDWKTILFGTTNVKTQASPYLWVTIEDMAACASRFNLSLTHQRIGFPSKLVFYDGGPVFKLGSFTTGGEQTYASYSYKNYYYNPSLTACESAYTSNGILGQTGDFAESRANQDAAARNANGGIVESFSQFYPYRFAAFEASNQPEWIQDVGLARVRADYTPAKTLQTNLSVTGGIPSQTKSYDLVSMMNPAFLMRNYTGRYATQPFFGQDGSYKLIAAQSYGTNIAQLVAFPEKTLLWGPEVPASPINRSPAYIPATLVNNNGSVLQTTVYDSTAFFGANSVCDRLMVFWDNRVDAAEQDDRDYSAP